MIVVRIRRSHLKAVVFAVLLLGAGVGVGGALADHDAGVIHACASRSNGSLRIVSSASDCRSNETALEWSREGSISIPQACPAGQFVTGIDANGELTCAAPGTTGGGGGGGGGTNACGNGVVDAGEACDTAGDSATCDANCTIAACGDGTVNHQAGEQCDPGAAGSSFCTEACRVSVCGDGILNPAAGESCDDGNTVSGDGCSAVCTAEAP